MDRKLCIDKKWLLFSLKKKIYKFFLVFIVGTSIALWFVGQNQQARAQCIQDCGGGTTCSGPFDTNPLSCPFGGCCLCTCPAPGPTSLPAPTPTSGPAPTPVPVSGPCRQDCGGGNFCTGPFDTNPLSCPFGGCCLCTCGAPAPTSTPPPSSGTCGECTYSQTTGCPPGVTTCCFQGTCAGSTTCKPGNVNNGCAYNGCGAPTTCSSGPVPTPTGAIAPTGAIGAACSGDKCADCVLNNHSILGPYKSFGWDTSCSNQINVYNDWCNKVDPTTCQQLKTTTCASVCVAPSPSGTPSSVCFTAGYPCNFLQTDPDKDCHDGTLACSSYTCGDRNRYVTGLGTCVPIFLPDACDENKVILNAAPNPSTEGGGVTLTLSGSQGAPGSVQPTGTQFQGTYQPRDSFGDPDPGILKCNFTAGFWGTTTCVAQKAGTLTWTHYWKNCSPVNANICTWECASIPYTITVNAKPTPTPPPPPCGTNPNVAECQTQIGVFNVSTPTAFIKTVITIVIGIAGLAAVILIIYAGYLFMTARGDKQKIANAREVLTAAILGLLFVIFSLLILAVIGVEILRIPGLVL